MKLPKLMLGTSPFLAAGQFGYKSLEYYRQFYLKPENIAEIYREAYELGIKALQLVVTEPTVKALEEVKLDFYLAASIYGNFKRNLKLVEKFNPQLVAVHAEIADSLNLPKIKECLEMVKRLGAAPAAATHLPGRTIPVLDRLGTVEAYLAPLNRLGLYMEPKPELSLKALEETPASIIAIKPLAAGKIKPLEALEYVYRYASSASVGLTSRSEILEVLQALKKLEG
ncbi:MAG: hypothetical protein AYL30_003870 [Candidatus Hecatellales archaeon B24]|nr:MAG: hypothetical protein AYL30_003870 [Candidatus Hecatellales archaeon B24]